MRTTLNIADDVLAAARRLADARHLTVGEALSELARSALEGSGVTSATATRNGISLLPSTGGAATLEDVNRLRDDLP